ncbi:hypothetical protein JB92DRAFT_817139 [Gautieria morchelliformis]|nr:hypothetical protein JB92DRAFT_817139 [Gautieria morchelliformis]
MASPEPAPSFQRVTFALNKDRCKQLAQTLLDSPHLADYTRELEVRVLEDRWARQRPFVDPDQSLPAAALCKISKLQSIQLYDLEMAKLTVDLHQSLRWVLLLPSLTSLTPCIGLYENINFVSLACHAESLMGLLRTCVILPSWQLQDVFKLPRGDQEDDEPRERSYLSYLNLGFALEGNMLTGFFGLDRLLRYRTYRICA